MVSRVFGIHQLMLRAGANAAEFERFYTREFAPSLPSGWRISLFKGFQGDREGRYAELLEVDSLEEFRRIFSGFDVATEEGQRWRDAHTELGAKYLSYVAQYLATDYLEVER